MRPRDRGLPWDAERVGMAALVAVALVFGVHSAIDWTWFVPANALCGLIAAAWVIARPPLRTRMEEAALAAALPRAERDRARDAAPLWAPPVAEPPPAADVAGPGALPVADAGWRRRVVLVAGARRRDRRAGARPRRRLGGGPARPLGQRRRRRDRAAAAGRAGGRRVDRPDRPRPQPALARAAVGARATSRSSAAGSRTPRTRCEEAVRIQPASAEAWRRLGRFQLSTLNQPSDALASFRAAYFLDPRNPASTSRLPRGQPRERPAGARSPPG